MPHTSKIAELTRKYFNKKGYTIEQDVFLEGKSGISHKFDLIITKSTDKRPVRILDWRRTVGVNAVITLDKASADVDLSRPIIVSEKFSSHAKAYANRKSIILLSKRNLEKF